MKLIDHHQRTFEYIRIGVTDKCNLRCQYCMPAEGLKWIPQSRHATIEEYQQLFELFSYWEIKKIRFTGGEPFIRKDFMTMVEMAKDKGFENIAITTNGVLTFPHLRKLKDWKVDNINFSMDSLDSIRFEKITRRNEWQRTMDSIEEALSINMNVSVNAVLLSDTTELEMHHMMNWALEKNIQIRFIEEMPFNGQGLAPDWHWNWRRVQNCILEKYPNAIKQEKKYGSTADVFKVDFSEGSIGIIAAYSRTFCGTCNRLRLTPEGNLHHCLYSHQSYPLLQQIREKKSLEEISSEVATFVQGKAINGFEAEKENQQQLASMAQIGG
jgi:molybdenum cofactor biosynthesis protein A